MKYTGIIRKIDELGRIVIPKEIRNVLHIKSNDALEFLIEDNHIILCKETREDLKSIADEIINNTISLVNGEVLIGNKDIIISDGKNIYDFNKNIDLLIVDEAYNLDKRHSGDRFLTIYNCYKILLSCSNKVILLGPFIKNLIGPESTDYKLCKTNYSPVTSTLYECDSLIGQTASNAFLHCNQNEENTIGFINSKTLIYDEMANILENGNLPDIYDDDFIKQEIVGEQISCRQMNLLILGRA